MLYHSRLFYVLCLSLSFQPNGLCLEDCVCRTAEEEMRMSCAQNLWTDRSVLRDSGVNAYLQAFMRRGI